MHRASKTVEEVLMKVDVLKENQKFLEALDKTNLSAAA